MKKKDLHDIIGKLGLDTIDFKALKKGKFKRKGKRGKKWALVALAALGAVVAYQLYSKTKKA